MADEMSSVVSRFESGLRSKLFEVCHRSTNGQDESDRLALVEFGYVESRNVQNPKIRKINVVYGEASDALRKEDEGRRGGGEEKGTEEEQSKRLQETLGRHRHLF